MPPSIWPVTAQRVERPPDVLGGRHLHDLHETELGIDVDDGAVGDERERDVAVALAVLVEVLGGSMVELDRLARTRASPSASATGTRSVPIESTTSVAVDHEPQRIEPVGRPDALEQPLAHRPAGRVDGAAAHPRLARRRRRAGRPDAGVDALEHHLVDAEDRRGRSDSAMVTKPWPTSTVANFSVATTVGPFASRQRAVE